MNEDKYLDYLFIFLVVIVTIIIIFGIIRMGIW